MTTRHGPLRQAPVSVQPSRINGRSSIAKALYYRAPIACKRPLPEMSLTPRQVVAFQAIPAGAETP